jgi:hypothetical protein
LDEGKTVTVSETQQKRKVGDGTPGPGRPKGSKDKIPQDVKAMVLEALSHAGGAEYLCMQAFDNPKAFLSLVGRVLPLQVTGKDGAPIDLAVSVDDTMRAARVAQLLALAEQRRKAQG